MSNAPIGLENFRRVLANAHRASKDNGSTLDLSDQCIGDLPIEILELIRGTLTRYDCPLKNCQTLIPRLALGHNLLTTLPNAIVTLNKLRYLNVRSNYLKEFPTVLCDMPTLEILDISRNKIRSLPRSFGSLTNLKVLSISKNRIEVLPSYIAQMAELRILKIDHNPIVFPPIEVTANEAGEDGMDAWLMNLKDYLETHAQKTSNGNVTDSPTTDDEGGENEYNTISKTTSSDITTASSLTSVSSMAKAPLAKSITQPLTGTLPPPPVPSKNSHRSTASHGSNSSVSNLRTFQLSAPKPADMERSRSNSESEELRRPLRRPMLSSRNRHLTTLQEDRARHSRGFSHDSHDYLQDNVSEAEGALPTPAEVQQNSRAYFRRLSSLPQAKRVSLSSAKIVETARGLLFSLSQIHQAVRQYVGFCPDPDLAATINRVLYNANAHVGALVDVLESHETNAELVEGTPVIEACRACVGAFRHVINILHKRLRDLTAQADIRYTRTLLLLLFGASVEIQNSWRCLKPVEHPPPSLTPATIVTNGGTVMPIRSVPPITRLKSSSNASQMPYLGMNNHSMPGKPNESVPAMETTAAETDEQLFEKIGQATTVTLSLLSLIGDAVSKSAVASAQGPATPGAVSASTNTKLRELAANSMNAGEVSRRLKTKVVSIKGMNDVMEKRKFWEDTNAFVKAVINVAALAKSVSSEYPFSKAILSSLSTVTRSTKELTILLSVSSFSQSLRNPESAMSSPVPQATPTSSHAGSVVLGPVGTPLALTTPGSALTTGTSNSTNNKFEEDFRFRSDLIRSNSTIKAPQIPPLSM